MALVAVDELSRHVPVYVGLHFVEVHGHVLLVSGQTAAQRQR